MNAFVHSSYVSERVLAQADVCMFAERMVLVVQSTHDDFILTPKLNRSKNKQTDHTRQFHLSLMMDYVFSYMHAFVHSSYVSEHVLAWADVCMFAEWMLFVVPSSPYDSILTQKLNRSTNKQTDHTRQFILCASKCVYVRVFMLNIWCLLLHLALVIDSYTCMSLCTRHTWARVYLHQCMCVCLLHECSLYFRLSLMMDLCVFIHECLCALVIRERACACTSRCAHVCWTNGVSCSIHPWWFHLDTEIKPIYEQTKGPYETIHIVCF